MSKFFEDIKEGLEEAIAYEEGKTTLRTHLVDLPEPPAKYTADDIKNIREKRNLSQSVFALYLNVSVKTVRSWESGERVPSQCALRLLELIDEEVFVIKSSKKLSSKSIKRKPKTQVTRRRSRNLKSA